jgi:flagellar motor component MotA
MIILHSKYEAMLYNPWSIFVICHTTSFVFFHKKTVSVLKRKLDQGSNVPLVLIKKRGAIEA